MLPWPLAVTAGSVPHLAVSPWPFPASPAPFPTSSFPSSVLHRLAIPSRVAIPRRPSSVLRRGSPFPATASSDSSCPSRPPGGGVVQDGATSPFYIRRRPLLEEALLRPRRLFFRDDDRWSDCIDLVLRRSAPIVCSSKMSTSQSSDESDNDDGIESALVESRRRRRRQNTHILYHVLQHPEKHLMKKKRVEPRYTGQQWIFDNLGNSKDCYDMFRMHKPCFDSLHDTLVDNYGLKGSTKMCSEEALGMFLWTLGSPQSVSQVHNRFNRSNETINGKFAEVLYCVNQLAGDIIKPIDSQFPTVHERLRDSRFTPHFNVAIGAIDGTHILVIVPAADVVNHVGRLGYPTQNVMAVCDFDLRFTSIVVGWPGSVHDTRIFKDTLLKFEENFPHPPPGRYYLVDSGYPNQDGYLAPYIGTKYHLPDFRLAAEAPTGKKEMFNHAHSSLRNAFERAFGVLKQKWRLLHGISSYPLEKQTEIIIACLALHNFIRDSQLFDLHFYRCDNNENYMPPGHVMSTPGGSVGNDLGGDYDTMNNTRDNIADALFAARGGV